MYALLETVTPDHYLVSGMRRSNLSNSMWYKIPSTTSYNDLPSTYSFAFFHSLAIRHPRDNACMLQIRIIHLAVSDTQISTIFLHCLLGTTIVFLCLLIVTKAFNAASFTTSLLALCTIPCHRGSNQYFVAEKIF